MAEETKQTINIDGKEYNYEDLSEVAQDAIQQLASLLSFDSDGFTVGSGINSQKIKEK